MADKPSLNEILKAVANMQASMKSTQDNLESTELTGKAGLDNQTDVALTINGRFKCLACKVSETFTEQERPVMEQLIIDALNDAVTQVGVVTRKQIETLSADLKENDV